MRDGDLDRREVFPSCKGITILEFEFDHEDLPEGFDSRLAEALRGWCFDRNMQEESMSLSLDRCSLGTHTVGLLSAALGVEPLVLADAEGSSAEGWGDSGEESGDGEGGGSNEGGGDEEGYSDKEGRSSELETCHSQRLARRCILLVSSHILEVCLKGGCWTLTFKNRLYIKIGLGSVLLGLCI